MPKKPFNKFGNPAHGHRAEHAARGKRGNSLSWPALYSHLLAKGHSKQKAAMISNGLARKRKGKAPKSVKGTKGRVGVSKMDYTESEVIFKSSVYAGLTEEEAQTVVDVSLLGLTDEEWDDIEKNAQSWVTRRKRYPPKGMPKGKSQVRLRALAASGRVGGGAKTASQLKTANQRRVGRKVFNENRPGSKMRPGQAAKVGVGNAKIQRKKNSSYRKDISSMTGTKPVPRRAAERDKLKAATVKRATSNSAARKKKPTLLRDTPGASSKTQWAGSSKKKVKSGEYNPLDAVEARDNPKPRDKSKSAFPTKPAAFNQKQQSKDERGLKEIKAARKQSAQNEQSRRNVATSSRPEKTATQKRLDSIKMNQRGRKSNVKSAKIPNDLRRELKRTAAKKKVGEMRAKRGFVSERDKQVQAASVANAAFRAKRDADRAARDAKKKKRKKTSPKR